MSNSEKSRELLKRYSIARIPFIAINTIEPGRALAILQSIAEELMLPFCVHSSTKGVYDLASDKNLCEDIESIDKINTNKPSNNGKIFTNNNETIIVPEENKPVIEKTLAEKNDDLRNQIQNKYSIKIAYKDELGNYTINVYGSEKLNDDSASLEQNPQEQMEYSMRQINEALADDLMLEILKMPPYDFEKLVVQLLKNMGYGEPIATKKSGDEGIDGLVKADKFGFDTIYVQAKQWKSISRTLTTLGKYKALVSW